MKVFGVLAVCFLVGVGIGEVCDWVGVDNPWAQFAACFLAGILVGQLAKRAGWLS